MQNLSLKFELPLIPTGHVPVLLPNINNKSMPSLIKYRHRGSRGIVIETQKLQDLSICFNSFLCCGRQIQKIQHQVFSPEETVLINLKEHPETLKRRQFQMVEQQRVINQPYTTRRRIPINKLRILKDVHGTPQPSQINIERCKTVYKIKMIGQSKPINDLQAKAKEYYSRIPTGPFELDTAVKARQPRTTRTYSKFQLDLPKRAEMPPQIVDMTPRQQIELENKWALQRTALKQPY